jgi:Lon protease-like protein
MPGTTTATRRSRSAPVTERSVTLPVLAVPEFVLFPGTYVTFHIGDARMWAPIALAARHHRGYLCVTLACGQGFENTGCVAEVREVVQTAQGVQVRLGGLERMSLVLDIDTTEGRYVQGICRTAPPSTTRGSKSMRQKLVAALLELPGFPTPIMQQADGLPWPLWLDVMAFHLPVPAAEKQQLLACHEARQRAERLLSLARNSPGRRPAEVGRLN